MGMSHGLEASSNRSGTQHPGGFILTTILDSLTRWIERRIWLYRPDAFAAVRLRLIERQIRLAQYFFDELEIPTSAKGTKQYKEIDHQSSFPAIHHRGHFRTDPDPEHK